MSSVPRLKSRMLIVSFIISIGFLFVYPQLKKDPKLKIYQPADVNPKLVDESVELNNKDHRVSEFELYSQNGDTIRLDAVLGNINLI
jgi:protein SCO1/2